MPVLRCNLKVKLLILVSAMLGLSSCASRIYQSVNEGENSVKISFVNRSTNRHLSVTTYDDSFACMEPRWISSFHTGLWQDHIFAPKAEYMTFNWEYWMGTEGLTDKTVSFCGSIFTFPMNAGEYRVEFDADPSSGQCGFLLYEKSVTGGWTASKDVVKRRKAPAFFTKGPWCEEDGEFINKEESK